MSEFQNFETSELVDLLAQHTQRLTELFTNNQFGNEYDRCKELIEVLLAEIAARRNPSSDLQPGGGETKSDLFQ